MRSRAKRALAILLLAVPAARAGQITLPYRVPPPRSSDTAAGTSRPVSFSADGRYLVFLSDAPNLVPGQVDDNLSDDVFLYDRATGTTTLVSHTASSPITAGGRGSETPAISADGRFVAFASAAQDLTLTRDPGMLRDVFLWDRLSGAVTLVSRSSTPGLPGDGESFQPSISGDGRYVAFTSAAKNLVSRISDFNQAPDVFLFDRQSGRVSLVSRSAASASQAGDRFADSPVISGDGRYVAYLSNSTNVVAGQSGTGLYNRAVYVYDRVAGTTVLASHRAGSRATLGDGQSMMPQISASGDVVAYLSYATDLVAGQVDDNLRPDVFLFYRPSGANSLVSHAAGAPARASGDGVDGLFTLSADGAYVAFTAETSDLVPGAPGGVDNVFLFERRSGLNTLVSRSTASPGLGGNGPSALGSVAISADGGQVAFWSGASDLAASSPDGPGVLVYDRRSNSLQRAGTATSPDSGVTLVTPVLSGDGAWTAFSSVRAETEGGLRDLNGRGDLYVYGRSLGGAELISRRDPGLPSKTPAGESRPGGLSDDGRYAVLTSEADNLLPRVTDTNGGADVLLYDRTLKTTTLVSRSLASAQKTANAPSVSPRLSADGRFVIYLSGATDLTADPVYNQGIPTQNVFVYDRASGASTLLTKPAYSGQSSGLTRDAVISADGSTVAVTTFYSSFLPGQTGDNTDDQIFLYNRATGAVSLVTHAFGSPLALAQGGSGRAAISGDGRFVAFYSGATNLLPTPVEKGTVSVYLYDRGTGLVSRAADLGFSIRGERFPLAISRDGRYIAFLSESQTLVPGQIDSELTDDLFLYDRTTGTLRLVSHLPGSPLTATGRVPGQAAFSADGRVLIFDTSGIPVPGQRNPGNADGVFLYDTAAGSLTAVGTGNSPYDPLGPELNLAISPNGRYVAFLDLPLFRLPPGGPFIEADVYLYDRTARQTTLVSAAGAVLANGTSDGPLFVSDTGVVLFASAASNLVPGDFNDGFPVLKDVFLYSPAP